MVRFEGAITVESIGHSGGIALLWRNKNEVTLKSVSKNHIDVTIELQEGNKFRLTGLYGEPNRAKRQETWDLIRNLSTHSDLPWCIIGDMNNVLSQEDKKGGRPYPGWLIQGFQNVVDDCNLHDMQLEGYQFTWEKSYGSDEWVEVRLDRALVSYSFMNQFVEAKLTNLEISTSDHSPIFLEPFQKARVVNTKKFRFENAWLRDPMCRKIVNEVWQEHEGKTLQEKILRCADILQKWGKEITGCFKTRINQSKAIMRAMKGRRDNRSVKVYQEESKKLTEIYSQQEVFWRQRSKQLWLREGDQNSKFFHTSAKTRRKTNHISSLRNNQGDAVSWENGLQDVMVDYFVDLFRATDTNWDDVISCVPCRITYSQNHELLEPIEASEVKKALFSMHPDKSPGPDGMSPGFYQKFWNIVGEDVVRIAQSFFDTGKFADHLTDTNIVLIPKKQDPSNMTELRPISLCNVAYKIVSKVLANRIKKVMNEIISETQSAFIPGRLITDNIMLSYEIMHFMKRKTKGKRGWMALKLDMSKAYDRVEWSFLKAMMVKLGFELKLVNLFMECVTSVSYSICHAGREFGSISPERGIRQGDPLSSYLFLICMEGLSALVQEREQKKLIKGIQVARGAPVISHMFFADDSYIFCQASVEMATQVSTMLSIYELASGQKVNVGKSSVFFSRNVEQVVKNDICGILRFSEASDHTTYLGLPNMLGKNKTSTLGYLKDRMQNRIQGWDKKHLSKGGKEIMLKTVIQAMPNYAMSIFLLPKQLCLDMERIMCRYWWRSASNQNRGIHWMGWDRMSKKKSLGGLGFRSMHAFNLALLGKQSWRLITQPNSLVCRMYKARYFPNDTFLTAKIGSNPSFVWRSLLETQELIKMGIARKVGAGSTVNIQNDPWLPDTLDPYIQTSNEALLGQMVTSLMTMDGNDWDADLVRDIFNSRDANLILTIPIRGSQADTWYWRKEKMGHYSVKSAYAVLSEQRDSQISSANSGFWRKLWNLKIPLKVKHFLWRASSDVLPTKEQLRAKRVEVCALCPVCNLTLESTYHILVGCDFASSCWNIAGVTNVQQGVPNFAEWFDGALQRLKTDEIHVVSMVSWALWQNRNDIVWKQKGKEPKIVVDSAILVLNQWQEAQDRSFDLSFGFMTQSDGVVQWKQPIEDTVKVNSDAAIFEDSGQYSFAMVARDHKGDLVEARACCKQGTVTPEMAEAIGVKEALSWVKDQGWIKVIVESDCLSLIQAIRCSSVHLSYFGNVVEECRKLLCELGDRNVILNFVKRSANKVAHYLARHTSSLADRTWNKGEINPEFQLVLFDDLKH